VPGGEEGKAGRITYSRQAVSACSGGRPEGEEVKRDALRT
jgi:hypothetical protein